MKSNGWIWKSRRNGNLTFDIINMLVMGVLTALFLYPMYLIAISAFSSPSAVYNGQVLFLPRGENLAGMQRVLSDDMLLRGYGNSIIYTAVGTVINITMTMLGAFVLSRKGFMLRKPLTWMIMLTMFFSGGMIPTFLLVKDLRLLNSIWSLVLPGAISTWNLLITRTFLAVSIPDELSDAAAIDGCNNWMFFTKTVLPLSTTVIAVIGMLYAVGHWNSYWHALLYIEDTDRYPLQLVLRDILLRSKLSAQMLEDSTSLENLQAYMHEIAESVKYIVVLAAVLPIMIVFPFVEKYFVKGVMIGSLKG